MDNIEVFDSYMIGPDGTKLHEEINVLNEHELNVYINESHVYKIICTRNDLKEMLTGKLYTDGLISNCSDIDDMYFCRYEKEANVLLKNKIDLEINPDEYKTCCSGNRTYLKPRSLHEYGKLDGTVWKPEWIMSMAKRFEAGLVLHDMTSGTHSCLLARGSDIIYTCEDIGRHNAVDKAIGYALINKIPLDECILYTSGRVPLDMVVKVISAGIGVLASKSVSTAEAVRLAKECGLTLICRAHADGIQVLNLQTY